LKNRTVACLLLIVALLAATEFAIFSANASIGDFWVTKTPIPSPSSDLESVLLNGKVYVIGTNISGTAGTNSNYIYDPATNTWTQKAPMPYFQSDFGLTTYNGQIYVIGGFVNNLPKATATIQVYNPTTDSWSNSTELRLPVAEAALSAITVNGKIYVMGGEFTGLATPIPYGINEVYDPNSNTWNTLASMPSATVGFAMTAVGDKIYVMGGANPGAVFEPSRGYSNETQIYDILTNIWSFGSPIPVTTSYSVAAATTGVFASTRIYYIAGPTQIYDPETGNWSIGATVPTTYVQTLATLNDTIYGIGGPIGTSNLTANEQYFPAGYTGPEPLVSPTPSVPEFSLATFPLLACLGTTLLATVFLKRRRTKN
jgi:hypothetical protein